MILPSVLRRSLTTILKWGLFLLLPLPLYISSSMLFPFITGRNFGFRIIIELLVVAWVGLLVLSQEYRPRLTPLVKAVILFLFVVTLADVLGANPYRSLWSNYERMEGWLALVHMVLFFLIMGTVFRRFFDWKLYIYGSTAVSIVVAFIGLSQKLGLTRSYQGGVRVDGTIGNPAYLASYLMFHVFFLLFFLWREKQTWLRWLAGAAIIFELFIIYLTATRGVVLAMLAVAGLLAVYFAFRQPKERRETVLKRIAITVLFLGIVLMGSFFAFRNAKFVRENPVLTRFATISTEERTVQSRFLIWQMAWHGVKERPILGWGQENFYLVFNKYFNPKLWSSEPWFDRSHNVFLDWMIHAGFVGLAAYLAMLFFGLRNVWQALRGQRIAFYEAGILGGLFMVYFFQNLFVFDNFQSYFLLFLTLGFTDYLAGANAVPPGELQKPNGQPSKAARVWVAVSVSGVLALFALYFLNLRPIFASQEIIQGLGEANRGASIASIRPHFENAIAYQTFGSGEAREQLATLVRNIVGSPRGGSPEEVKKFVEFATGELRRLVSGPAPDAKHLLFLGSIYNSSVALDPTYGREALNVLQRALQLSPTKQQIYFELTSTYLALGNLDAALEAIEKAAQLDPSFPNAHLNAAVVAIVAGKREVGERELAAYRSLVPKLDETTIQRLIDAYVRVNDFRSIKSLLEEGIRTFPDSAELYGRYAAALSTLGDKEGAKTAARKAGALNPELQNAVDQFIKDLDSGQAPK
ncbi:MAG: O-antigen ligase family protein [Candidatus Sungbacteria bacterium]|uniref:O-antigen ligase family protein n=1 Tax=Candidatus Sungiibacteriota bacterium TaxID=2750080 RepID=A0A931SAY8_9BACT|nr:O-antigen ligase family protein [Candidatus Sungbacteria bacterium]